MKTYWDSGFIGTANILNRHFHFTKEKNKDFISLYIGHSTVGFIVIADILNIRVAFTKEEKSMSQEFIF